MNRRSTLIIFVIIIALILIPSFMTFAQESDSAGSSPSIPNIIKFTLIAFAGSIVGYWQSRKKEDDTIDE